MDRKIKGKGCPTNYPEHYLADYLASHHDKDVQAIMPIEREIQATIDFGEEGLKKVISGDDLSRASHSRCASSHVSSIEVTRLLEKNLRGLSPEEKRGVKKVVRIHQNADIRGSGGDCDMIKLTEDFRSKKDIVSEQEFPRLCGCDAKGKTKSHEK